MRRSSVASSSSGDQRRPSEIVVPLSSAERKAMEADLAEKQKRLSQAFELNEELSVLEKERAEIKEQRQGQCSKCFLTGVHSQQAK